MISCHHHHLKRPSGICDCWDDNKDIFSDIVPRSQKLRHRHRHDVNLKSETYSQIIKGGRGQSVLYSCPCNGHVKVPNFTTPLPPTLSSYQHQPLLLLFRSVHFQSSDISWKDSGAGSWGQWGRKFSGIYLTLLLSESGGYFCHAWHRNI